jgi:hypothetical protein
MATAKQQETQRLLNIRQELMLTCRTRGWSIVKQIAANVISAATQAAKDAADDDTKGLILLRKAKVADEIFRDLFSTIETTMQIGTEDSPDWFAELAEAEKAVEEEQIQ